MVYLVSMKFFERHGDIYEDVNGLFFWEISAVDFLKESGWADLEKNSSLISNSFVLLNGMCLHADWPL